MNRAEQDNRITGIRLTANCPSVQHLLFADDSLFVCRASFKEGGEILQCLKAYGEEINFQKSAITFGKKIDPIMKRLLGLYMRIEKEGGDGKYLGLPECFSGSKRELLAYITDRLQSRLTGWFAKTLSLGGKEVLLKSVAMALPVYATSCFRLTKHQCQKLTSAMASFWWNSSEEHKKMHWVSWEKMCKSKQNGGLGFRDIGDFNQALLAKQAWRFLSDPNSLVSRVYQARYYKESSFLNAAIGNRPSYAWRSIIHGRELLEKGLMKSIGDGKDTRVWMDKWIFDDEPRRPFNQQTFIDLNLKISNLITPQGSWNQSLLNNLFLPDDVVRIISYPPLINTKYKHIWAYNQNGVYSVKSGSWLVAKLKSLQHPEPLQNQDINGLKAKVWDMHTLPKIMMFLWRALSGALAVSDCLNRHGLNTPLQCGICNSAIETIYHVLFLCWPAKQVWESANIPLPRQGFSSSLQLNMDYMILLMKKSGVAVTLQVAIPWLLWGIWKYRNEFLYADTRGNLDLLVTEAFSESATWTRLKETQPETQAAFNHDRRTVTRWLRPPPQVLKCNVNASWPNATSMCGGAWIARNHQGDAVFHAREVFLPNSNRIAAELRCIIWTIQSMCDIGVDSVEIWSDCKATIEAILDFINWPRYHTLTTRVHHWIHRFRKISFHVSEVKANRVAREIATSVTRDGRVQSYLARGGPSWLQHRIEEDKHHV